MSKTLLQQLRTMTTVVADTGDIEAIEQVKPQDATTNPSLITAAAQMPQYQPIVDGVLQEARKKLGEDASDKDVAKEAFKHLAIAFGKQILEIVKIKAKELNAKSDEAACRIIAGTARNMGIEVVD